MSKDKYSLFLTGKTEPDVRLDVSRWNIVCRECWYRDREEQEWESYLKFMGNKKQRLF
jgi:hypothetical protein